MIKAVVDEVTKKYHTRDPYELADRLGIIIERHKLEDIGGYYIFRKRIKYIALRSDLEHMERFVLAHELGHALLHPKTSAVFLPKTFFSKDKFERQANKFAVELLIYDLDLFEHWYYTHEQLAMLYGLPVEMIRLRLDVD